jgi:hypothetical protein
MTVARIASDWPREPDVLKRQLNERVERIAIDGRYP